MSPNKKQIKLFEKIFGKIEPLKSINISTEEFYINDPLFPEDDIQIDTIPENIEYSYIPKLVSGRLVKMYKVVSKSFQYKWGSKLRDIAMGRVEMPVNRNIYKEIIRYERHRRDATKSFDTDNQQVENPGADDLSSHTERQDKQAFRKRVRQRRVKNFKRSRVPRKSAAGKVPKRWKRGKEQ